MIYTLFNVCLTTYLLFLGIDPIKSATVMLIVKVWDAINDPLIGSMIDNDKRKYKMGKYKTYIFIGACGLLVGGAAVFLPFPKADTVVKAILFVLGYIIWDAAYTMANVPYGTMLNIVTEKNEDIKSFTKKVDEKTIKFFIDHLKKPYIFLNKVLKNGKLDLKKAVCECEKGYSMTSTETYDTICCKDERACRGICCEEEESCVLYEINTSKSGSFFSCLSIDF